MKRLRRRLVPEGGIECFEVRIVHYFDRKGDCYTDAEVSVLPGLDPPYLHEVIGVMEMGRDIIKERWEREQ